MQHCPPCPAPTCIYLHRGAVLPVRSDLIAPPLLKPEHICLVIIKSWGGTPRSEAQTCRSCEHQCLCRWSDRAAPAWARSGPPAPRASPRSCQLLSVHPSPRQSPGTPVWEVALQSTEQKELGLWFRQSFRPRKYPRISAGRWELVGAAAPPLHTHLCVQLTPPSHAPWKSPSTLSLIASMLGCLEEALPALSPPLRCPGNSLRI